MTKDNEPEILWDGTWVPICGYNFWDNKYGAKLFCKKLGFKNGIVKSTRSKLTRNALRLGRCSRFDTNLENCSGGCNDFIIGSNFVDWGRCKGVCRKKKRGKVTIECS